MKKKTYEQINATMIQIADILAPALENMVANQEKKQKENRMLGIQHVQKGGTAHYDDYNKFLFTPDHPAKNIVEPYRSHGIAQLKSDGTFDFIRQPRLRAQSELIRKLAHGRVSKTKDGAIQLTLKVYQDEGINISEAIYQEAGLAKDAIVEWQMKR